MNQIFSRTQLLLGKATMMKIASAKVIIFGVGGVGSWCAESLVRMGVRHLTIVDSDCVAASNVNRQLMATCKTIGKVKVNVLKDRLKEINPEVEVNALQMIYDAANAESFHIEQFDYVVDAIDSLEHKANLILHATRLSKERGLTFFSSMGAALRMDPFAIRSAEFWDIKGDGLARALRNRFKRDKKFPFKKFRCVYSEETPMKNRGAEEEIVADSVESPIDGTRDLPEVKDTWTERKAQTNGTVSYVTSIFGLSLAGLIIRDIDAKATSKQ